MTVIKYQPKDWIVAAMDSISIILAAIKNATPSGEILQKQSYNWWCTTSILHRAHLPYNPWCYGHHCLAECREEILQQLSLLTHSSDCRTQYHTEHDQTKHIGSLTLSRLEFPILHGLWMWLWYATLCVFRLIDRQNLFTYVLAKCWCFQKSPCDAVRNKILNIYVLDCPAITYTHMYIICMYIYA